VRDDPGDISPASRRPQYEGAASWAADIHGSLRASRRTAWIVAGVALTIAALEALAIVALTPLKTVVPYTLLVDRQTGYVETIRGLRPGPLSQQSAVTQSFLVQYVIARETFDATDLRENYHKVMLWTSGAAREEYQHYMARSDPNSPLNLYTPSTILATTIKSVDLLSPTTALVRFATEIRQGVTAAAGDQRDWTAVVSFRYTGAPMTMGDRFLNPLGFQVTRYRRDADSPATAAAPMPQEPLGGPRS
jgi:type IV secretion system protein VirB8